MTIRPSDTVLAWRTIRAIHSGVTLIALRPLNGTDILPIRTYRIPNIQMAVNQIGVARTTSRMFGLQRSERIKRPKNGDTGTIRTLLTARNGEICRIYLVPVF